MGVFDPHDHFGLHRDANYKNCRSPFGLIAKKIDEKKNKKILNLVTCAVLAPKNGQTHLN